MKEKLFIFLIGMVVGALITFLVMRGIRTADDIRFEQRLNDLNARAQTNINRILKERDRLQKRKEADWNEINNMSDADLVDELFRHSED